MIITASPAQAAFPINVSALLYFWFTIGPAVAANIRMKVPTNSAPSCIEPKSMFTMQG
jgi:hypothetical protein